MSTKYSRGSEWRKWDLHVHTPASIEQHYEGENESQKWERFISELEQLPPEFKVIGINDYIFLDGYKKVLEYQRQGRLANIELILPVIELRLAKFCGTKQFKRINFHIIFSDKLTADVIEGNFLAALTSKYSLDPNSGQDTWNGIVNKDNLIRLGQAIIDSAPEEKKKDFDSPLVEGFNNLNLEVNAIYEALHNSSSLFQGKYLTAIGKTEWDDLKWDDTSIAEKKTIINKADFIFTASESIEKFYSAKRKLSEQRVRDLLLDCSDAHHNINSTEKDRLGNCATWIKADPTFEGLKQVLNEPSERIFIGEEPAIFDRVKNNKTKYIDKVTIKPIDGYLGTYGKWFDNIEVELNKELVAVIGNKGNGKSALTDIIAHCCCYPFQDYFSFLNKHKFRDGRRADNFIGSVTFADDQTKTKGLAEPIVDGDIPLVKYMPQGYFETICNDLQKEENLRREIENVVFQYIDSSARLGASSFDELIKTKTEAVNTTISELKKQLFLLNESIITLEDKENPRYRAEIEAKISQKVSEIAALTKPEEVAKPTTDDEKVKKVLAQIELLNEANTTIDKQIEELKTEQNQLAIDVEKIKAFIENANNKVKGIIDFKEQNAEYILSLGIRIDEILQVTFNIDKLNEVLQGKKKRYDEINTIIQDDSSLETNLSYKRKQNDSKIKAYKAELDEPSKKYQEYLKKLAEFEEAKKKIEGDAATPNTLMWYKKELEYIDGQLGKDISDKYEERDNKTREIYQKKKEVIDIYLLIKNKIDATILANKDLLSSYDLKIDALFGIENSTINGILYYINQSVRGSFRGKSDGEALLSKIVHSKDLNNEDETINLCTEIINKLKEDEGEKRFIGDQVSDRLSFYNKLFSLDYLTYNYRIMQGDKDLSLLSPGEKGALLLVFYLLLDMDNSPLILDQPEDNLDNDSVANILVDFIKQAKQKRQIIMVTHNPNLAVVADAEQVIYVSIDKKDDCKVSVESGSIEEPIINEHIVKVLEGAMPAFRKRDNKYLDLSLKK